MELDFNSPNGRHVYPKLSTDAYSFQLHFEKEGDSVGTIITLLQVETGKTKVFKMAGVVNHRAIMNHMNSLTDDLCSQWFNVREVKKKQK